MRRLLSALRAALRCAYHGACMGFAWPELQIHVVASNLGAAGLRTLLEDGAQNGMADLERELEMAAGEDLLKRSGLSS
jgi:hypothetical protein